MASFSPSIQNGLNLLKKLNNNNGLSLIAKTLKIKLNTQTIVWKDYSKLCNNDDIKHMLRSNLQEWHRHPDHDESKHSEYKKIVCLFLALIQKTLFDYCKTKNIEPEDLKWFLQAEFGQDSHLHIHILLLSDFMPSKYGKWMVKQLRQSWSKWLLQCCIKPLSGSEKKKLGEIIESETEPWIDILKYTHRQTKKQYVKNVNPARIITYYFLGKEHHTNTESTSFYYLSLDCDFAINGLSTAERLILKKYAEKMLNDENKENINPEEPVPETINPPEAKKRRVQNQKETSIQDMISHLYTKLICTQEQWMLQEPESYIHFATSSNGNQTIELILNIVNLKLSKEQNAWNIIISNQPKHTNIKKTKIWDIFKNNGFNPIQCMHAIFCCLNKDMGKQNTILLFGPANTGKSNLAESLTKIVTNFGTHNPSNANFPFNDCNNKNLLWFEELGNPGAHVNTLKCLMSGQSIRLDRKGTSSMQVTKTPVIITTNEKIWIVKTGSTIHPEHTKPLQARCLFFHLTNQLTQTFGCVSEDDWITWAHWMNKENLTPTLQTYLNTWTHAPTWGCSWNTPYNSNSDDVEHIPTNQENSSENFSTWDSNDEQILEDLLQLEQVSKNIIMS